jgi:hypothetical protein
MHNTMHSFQTVKFFYEFKMSPWLELSMNNTLISVRHPLNIWPQNNKQILYYLTQFHPTLDILEKNSLSGPIQWLKQKLSSPRYAWIVKHN